MLINWFTVIAQVVNFLILVLLLKRFLYGPILAAIDAREKGIAARLAEAEKKQREAQTVRDDFQQKSEALELQRGALLKTATEDANTEHERLLADARKDADAVRSAWADALRNEQHALEEEIVRRTRVGVFDIARKALTELATVDLEVCMSNVFISRLPTLSAAEHDQLTDALKGASPSQPALVRSTFDLPQAQRTAIETAVDKTFAVQPQFQYETAPNIVSGIELTADGQKVAWSIADFLNSLEKNVGGLLEEKTKEKTKEEKPEIKSEVKPEPAAQLVSK